MIVYNLREKLLIHWSSLSYFNIKLFCILALESLSKKDAQRDPKGLNVAPLL